MTREIKFRAYDTLNKRMIQDYFFLDSDGGVWYDQDLHGVDMSGKRKILSTNKLIIMQWTGLKDKNNIDIYEGDIVKWGHVKGGEEMEIRIAEVKINPDIQFDCKNISYPHIFHYGSFIYTNTKKYLEVIGNLHEHPHLLVK